jgi:phosphatidate cytidylyltransferase
MPNLAKRILSAALMLPAVIALLLLGPACAIAALVVFFSFLAGLEFAAICFRERSRAFKALYALLCSACAGAVCLSTAAPLAPLAAFLAVVPIAFLLFLFSAGDRSTLQGSVTSAAFAALGLSYCGALLGSVSLFFPIPSLGSFFSSAPSREGRLWILLLLCGIIASDTFAYAFGRLFGVRKLAPRISPGKTWAGAFGSVFGTILAVLVFSFFLLPSLPPLVAAALGLLLSFFGQLGDLCESLLKRGFSVKDSGKLIPGHGGVLDRLDSLMFGAPVALLFFYWTR